MSTKSIRPNLSEEILLWNKGVEWVIGIDEVGRGAFAGPVVVAAVVFPQHIYNVFAQKQSPLRGIADSKLLSPAKREALVPIISSHAQVFAYGQSSVAEINKHGVWKATKTAFRRVLRAIYAKTQSNEQFVLVDGNSHIPFMRSADAKHQKTIVKGDQKSVSIAAASILAKVYRDAMMTKYHTIYPHYGFDKHKGYGTKLHQKAIAKYALCKLHRTSFHLDQFLTKTILTEVQKGV